MNFTHKRRAMLKSGHRKQRGALSIFTAVMVLFLLTLMALYATQAGVFEQRDSSNDDRQKRAFHAAESGIEYAAEFILAHSVLVGSYEQDLVGEQDGWLLAGDEQRWFPCDSDDVDLSADTGTHPCYGEPNETRRLNMYYYVDPVTDTTALPVDLDDLNSTGAIEQVTVESLLCMVTEGFVSSAGTMAPCTLDPDEADGVLWAITFLARGGADCESGTCLAEAKIAERMTHGGAIADGRGPDVPLITKSSFPPSGTAEVVPNPDGGGQGVPISVWGNDNESCEGQNPINPSSGSWATCEMHEWYGQDLLPDDVACPGNCSCTEAESISYTHATSDTLGLDLVMDEEFPCDLFEYFFGIPRSEYEVIKSAATVLSDCSTLGENSFGLYWVTGPECFVNSNTTIGSKDAPVTLISAASMTRFNGGAKLFGILYIADVEDSSAEFQSLGTNTVYGTVIVDGTLGSYNGTFQVVYNENIIKRGVGSGALIGLAGGWTDYHESWE